MLDEPLNGSIGEGTPNAPRLSVETWLAVPTRAGLRVLMLRRTEAEGGFWQGVSGCVESADETLRLTAEREIFEELGIHGGFEICDLGRWIEFVSPFSGVSFRKRSLGTVLPSGTTAESVRLSDEHAEARLVTFDEARAMVTWEENLAELTALEQLIYGD